VNDTAALTRVLVVDDIPLMRTMLRKYVSIIGASRADRDMSGRTFEVVEAANGLMAMDTLSKEEIHLIFLDLMMPEMDGITFLEKIQEDPAASQIPVVVTTALSEEAGVARALALGARSYIRKPFTIEAVEQQVRQLLGTPTT
jgi:CheY-like chemotaxis protein